MKNHPSEFELPIWEMKSLYISAYPIGKDRVVCVLYQIEMTPSARCGEPHDDPPIFAIGMGSYHDKQFYAVGQDAEKSLALFKLIVQMKVAPCTLRDVVEDYVDGLKG